MIKGYKISENEDTIHCGCEIECEGGVPQFKAELSAIIRGIRQDKLLRYLMTEVIGELAEEEEENESKSVS